MDEAERAAWVVDRLGDAVNREDVIFELCQSEGWDWPQAEAYVEKIERIEVAEITRHKSPALFILSLGAMLLGLAWSGAAYYALFQPLLHNLRGALTIDLLTHSAISVPMLIPQIIAGMGLAVGGVIGLINTIQGMSN